MKSPEERRAQIQAWRDANRERMLAHDRAYRRARREADPDGEREKRRRHAREPVARAKAREWKKAHSDRVRQQDRARYLKRREEILAYNAAWAKAHPETIAAKKARYRARKRGATKVEKIDRAAIIARDKSTCYLCGRQCGDGTDLPLHLDHVIALGDPESQGEHTAANLAVACGPCNSRKRNKPVTTQLRLVG